MSTTRAGTVYKNNFSRMEEVENEARDNIDERGGVFEGGVREPMSEVMQIECLWKTVGDVKKSKNAIDNIGWKRNEHRR